MNCRRLALPLALLLVALLAGCRPTPQAGAPRLQLTRFRYNIDEKHEVVRVVGEIANLGATPVPQVEISATLLSAGGSARGENTTLVKNLPPGRRKTFGLNVTSHGGTSRVELRYRVPGAS